MNKYSRHLTYSFTSSYGLVRDWVIKKMNLDEQIFKRVDKTILIQLVNQNVNPFTLLKIIKSPVFTGLFFCPNILLEHEESTKKARRKNHQMILLFETT